MRKTLLIVIAVILAVAFSACTQPVPVLSAASPIPAASLTPHPTATSATPTPTLPGIREMQPKKSGGGYSEEFVTQYITEHTSAPGEAVTVPVYREEQILYSMECFTIGHDAGRRAHLSGLRSGMFEDMVTMFPDPVVRDIGEFVYIYYDTENQTRLYVFYSKAKSCFFTDGFPIIMKKTLSYQDFAALEVGDTVQQVADIDPIGPLHLPVFDIYSDDMVKNMEDHTNWYQTIHLLSDGILRINYDKVDGEYIIISMIYNEDFILDGLDGQTCYRIYDEDYME